MPPPGSLPSPERPQRGPSLREAATSVALLAALGLVAFGTHVAHGGFYNDDWSFAVTTAYAPGSGFFAAVRAFDWMAFRPGAAVYLALTHLVFGTNPGLHLALAVGVAVAMAGCLYLLLRTLGLEALHAGAIAALVLIFPLADSTRLWAAASISNVGIALYLLGTVVALRGLSSAGRRSTLLHLGAVSLYLLSVMSYEIAVGAICLSILLYRTRASWRRAAPRWAIDVAATGILVFFVTSNSWNKPEPLLTQLQHARTIAAQSLRVLTLSFLPFAPAPTAIGVGILAAIALAGIVLARLLRADDPARAELHRWLLNAAGGVIAVAAGYSVFVVADPNAYAPLAPGQHNRVNGLAAVGFVFVIYSLVMVAGTLLFRGLPNWRRYAICFAVAASVLVGTGYLVDVRSHSAQWDQSWAMQKGILTDLQAILPNPPRGATIYSARHPIESAPGIPVFAAPWDLAGAVRLRWDDVSLAAFPIIPGTTFDCGGGAVTAHNANDAYGLPQRGDYGRTFIIDVSRDSVERITDRGSCTAATRQIQS